MLLIKASVLLLFGAITFPFQVSAYQLLGSTRDEAIQISNELIANAFSATGTRDDLRFLSSLEYLCNGSTLQDYWKGLEPGCKESMADAYDRRFKEVVAKIEARELEIDLANKPICYQSTCLGDPISKFNLPISADRKPYEESINLNQRPFVLERAKTTFVAPPQSIATLAAKGFSGGSSGLYAHSSAINANPPEILSALKSIETLCDAPEKSVFVDAMMPNGRKAQLSYRATTLSNGSSTYTLDAIDMSHPGVRSRNELYELLQKAVSSISTPLRCEPGRLVCFSENMRQRLEIESREDSAQVGISYYRASVGRPTGAPRFDLNAARNHPSCKKEISF